MATRGRLSRFRGLRRSFSSVRWAHAGGDIELGEVEESSAAPLRRTKGDFQNQPSTDRLGRSQRMKLAHGLLAGAGRSRGHAASEHGRCRFSQLLRSSHIPWPLLLVAVVLLTIGFFDVLVFVTKTLAAFCRDDFDWVLKLDANPTRSAHTDWEINFTTDIHPVRCHSHNDYWRQEPLHSALKVGCVGVEADVWLFEDELYVGHYVASLMANRTLSQMYIQPLMDILDRRNPPATSQHASDERHDGVFDTRPNQSLVLPIDFKTDGQATWAVMHAQLEPLRERQYLTFFNGTSVVDGPVTVVVTDNAPFDKVVADPHYRDVFFDAPLDLMASVGQPATVFASLKPGSETEFFSQDDNHISASPSLSVTSATAASRHRSLKPTYPENPSIYSPANSYYASISFTDSIGFPWHSRLSHHQTELIRKQIRGAHARGLKVRYWAVPSWPIEVRNYLWRVLVREGVDCLNVDDLTAATQGEWGPKKGGWGRKWWT